MDSKPFIKSSNIHMGEDGFIIFGAKSCLILQNNKGCGSKSVYFQRIMDTPKVHRFASASFNCLNLQVVLKNIKKNNFSNSSMRWNVFYSASLFGNKNQAK